MDIPVRRLFLAGMLAALPTATLLPRAQSVTEQRPIGNGAGPSGVDLLALNRSVEACTDFYQFACGGWMIANPIPPDRPRWGRFDEVSERNLEIMRRLLERAATSRDPESRKIGNYYASCMDEAAIEHRGLSPLESEFRNIGLLSVTRLPALLARLHRNGVDAFFRFGSEGDFKNASMAIAALHQGGLGLPDRDDYLRNDDRSESLRLRYVEHISALLQLSGEPAARADAQAEGVTRIETMLARAALDRVSRRNPELVYHKMSPTELQALTPNFDWSRYFAAIGAPAIREVNVSEPAFMKAFSDVLASTSVGEIQAYLRWRLVHAYAQYLPKALVDEDFQFYGVLLQGLQEQRPRWKRCVGNVDSALGEALGKAFVRERFGPEAKADMLAMVADVKLAFERNLTGLDWMADTTRREAMAKLHATTHKIGYPDTWRDYRGLSIERGDALGNAQRANAFEFRRQLAKIGKRLDKSEWSMTPPTVNAYYDPLQNNINFPAGILQPPFYAANRDSALNYGSAAAVIGHELTHGFDDQGRRFDAGGALRDWWSPEDGKAYEQRSGCFVDQYSGFSAIDDVSVNGRLTLGENTADNGGLRAALMAYLGSARSRAAQTLDGFTPEQRVFLGWAQVWCENRRPEYERLQARTNPHSPGRYRVNGVLANMEEFQKAFMCASDAPMVSRNRCRVW
jgi:endothelin-converting enzyme/putative endopeptidase